MNIVLIVVLQLLSYGGFLNLSLGDGGSDSAQCDLLLEVRGCGAGKRRGFLSVAVLSLNL